MKGAAYCLGVGQPERVVRRHRGREGAGVGDRIGADAEDPAPEALGRVRQDGSPDGVGLAVVTGREQGRPAARQEYFPYKSVFRLLPGLSGQRTGCRDSIFGR